MTGLPHIKLHLEVMLELSDALIKEAPKHRYKEDADEWDKGYWFGREDATKTERTHLEMLLKLVNTELEKTAENPKTTGEARPAA